MRARPARDAQRPRHQNKTNKICRSLRILVLYFKNGSEKKRCATGQEPEYKLKWTIMRQTVGPVCLQQCQRLTVYNTGAGLGRPPRTERGLEGSFSNIEMSSEHTFSVRNPSSATRM